MVTVILWVLMLFSSSSAGERFSQCTNSERAHHIALIFGRAACIAYGLCCGSSKIGSLVNTCFVQRLTKQRLFCIPCLDWNLPDVGQTNTRIAYIAIVIQRYICCNTSNSIISHLSLQLDICPTTSLGRSRNANLREQLIGM